MEIGEYLDIWKFEIEFPEIEIGIAPNLKCEPRQRKKEKKRCAQVDMLRRAQGDQGVPVFFGTQLRRYFLEKFATDSKELADDVSLLRKL